MGVKYEGAAASAFNDSVMVAARGAGYRSSSSQILIGANNYI